MELW
jgi:hypothetical protein